MFEEIEPGGVDGNMEKILYNERKHNSNKQTERRLQHRAN